MAEPTQISSYHDRDLDRAAAEGGHGLATSSLEMLDRESPYDVRGASNCCLRWSVTGRSATS